MSKRPKYGKKVDREGPIHRSIVSWLGTVMPDAMVYHCRNEINMSGWRVAKEQADARKKGAIKGFTDLLVLPYANVGAFFLEVKSENGRVQPEQAAVHERLQALGYRVAVVRSIDDVRAALDRWGVGYREVRR